MEEVRWKVGERGERGWERKNLCRRGGIGGCGSEK